MLINCVGVQPATDFLHGSTERPWGEIEVIAQEIVGMLKIDAVGLPPAQVLGGMWRGLGGGLPPLALNYAVGLLDALAIRDRAANIL